MGFFSSIFGGGGTKVSQSSKTNVTVDNQVAVDNKVNVSTEEIAAVLAKFNEDTKAILKQIGEGNALELISQIEFNDLVRKRTKQAGVLAVGLFSWWFFTRKKKGKK